MQLTARLSSLEAKIFNYKAPCGCSLDTFYLYGDAPGDFAPDGYKFERVVWGRCEVCGYDLPNWDIEKTPMGERDQLIENNFDSPEELLAFSVQLIEKGTLDLAPWPPGDEFRKFYKVRETH